MQHVNASDSMSGSAKQAVDTALTDARTQRVGGTTPSAAPATPAASPDGASARPEATRPAAQA